MSGTQNSVTVSEAGTGPYAQVVVAGRHVLSADEPESRGGHDTGPSPYDYVAAGLGCCTAITLRMYIERHRWAVRRIVVEVTHEKVPTEDGAGKIDRFERTIHLDGELSDEQQRRLLQIADKCPVSETLGQRSIVNSRLMTVTPSAAGLESQNRLSISAVADANVTTSATSEKPPITSQATLTLQQPDLGTGGDESHNNSLVAPSRFDCKGRDVA